VPFFEHLKQCARENPNFKFNLTLTQELDRSDWRGKRGRIDEAMIKEVTQDMNNTVFYVCGPPSMVMELKQILIGSGIPFERIKTELFTGYQ
jgi:ferredoxin-NADP reductase